MTFLVAHAALDRGVDAEHVADGLPERLGTVADDQYALLDVKAALDEVASSVVETVAFSVEPSHSPSGCLTPSVSMPNATTQQRPLSSIPSSISPARRRSASGRLMSSIRFSRVRETNSWLTADLLVDLEISSISDPTGSPVR